MTTTKPNFFIVGAPKCATTALATYLDRHPEVRLIGKEVHFFGSDLEFRRRLPTLDEYLAMAKPLAHLRAVGDASVYYLFSKAAPGEIKAYCPEARIIVMLRNPVDVMYSLHRQLLSNADEDIEEFEAALAAEPERAAGRRIPRSAHPVHALRYRAISAFSEQVARYLQVFGRERVLILLYDDMVWDAPGVFRTTLEFLGVDPEFRTTFERINEARRLRFRTARRIQKNMPKAMLNWMPRPLWSSVSATYCGLVYADAKPSPMRPALRARLLEEFRPEIDRLGSLVDRDLGYWYEPATSGARPKRSPITATPPARENASENTMANGYRRPNVTTIPTIRSALRGSRALRRLYEELLAVRADPGLWRRARDLQAISRECFGWVATTRPRWWEYPWALREVERGLNNGRGKILEAGAGRSPFAVALARAGHTVIVADPNSAGSGTRFGGEWTWTDYSPWGIRTVKAGMEERICAPAELAAAVSISVIEHVPAAIRRRGLDELARAVMPGGLLVLTVDLIQGSDRLWNRLMDAELEPPEKHGCLEELLKEADTRGFAKVACTRCPVRGREVDVVGLSFRRR